MKLFGLNIGKKADGAAPEAPAKAEKPKKDKATKAKKEKAPKPAKAAKAKSLSSGGELNVYTGVLLAALLVLGTGAAMIAMTNLDAVAGTGDDGNPFAVMSGR